MPQREYNLRTWSKLYDQLTKTSPKEIDVVWTNNLYDISFLKRNDRHLYDSLKQTKDIMSDDCSNPVPLTIKNHRK